jgi:serine/threonine protein kinase
MKLEGVSISGESYGIDPDDDPIHKATYFSVERKTISDDSLASLRGKRCALKILHNPANNAGLRLAREGAIYTLLNRECPESPYFATLLGSGADHLLLTWLDEMPVAEGPVDPISMVALFHRTMLALTLLHKHGIIHRDVKPSNVLYDPETKQLRLIDFSHAHLTPEGGATAEDLTGTGSVVGTEPWIAPEQRQGAFVPETDVFNAACVFIYATTGRKPEPGHLPDVRPADGMPTDLATLMSACLRADPHGRPSAAEVAANMHSMLAQWKRTGPRRAPQEPQLRFLHADFVHEIEELRKETGITDEQALRGDMITGRDRRALSARSPSNNSRPPATLQLPVIAVAALITLLLTLILLVIVLALQ